MNHAADDEDDWSDEDELPGEPAPAEPFPTRGCLADVATLGLTALSMAGGILVSCLALGQLLQAEADGPPRTLNLGAMPLAFSWLLRGFACQALVALGLFACQLHRQVRALVPGMALIGVVALLLLLIELNA